MPVLKFIFKYGKAIPIAGQNEDPEVLAKAYRSIQEEIAEENVLGIFPEGKITTDGEIQAFKTGIEKIVEKQPVPVVPMALCNLWGSLFSRRDPLLKRRPYKFRARIELRIGEPIAPAELTAERLEQEIRKLRGPDR